LTALRTRVAPGRAPVAPPVPPEATTPAERAALLSNLAAATGSARLRALAARELKPLGGRRAIDLTQELRRMDQLLADGTARRVKTAARWALMEVRGVSYADDIDVARLVRASRPSERKRKLRRKLVYVGDAGAGALVLGRT